MKKFSKILIAISVYFTFIPFLFASESGEHWSIFNSILPQTFFDNLKALMGNTYIFHTKVSSVIHIFMALIVLIVGILMAIATSKTLRRRLKNEDIIPDKKFSLLNFFEAIIDYTLDLMASLMGEENAIRFFPLIGALAFFILFSNLMGQIPGLLPPTANFNTNFAMAGIVFLYYNYHGFKKHGLAYLNHFLGPIRKWYALPLMIFMFIVEIIGHIVRPISLSIRLMGNMFGDHMVLSIFLGFHIVLLPIPIELLGLLVALVQTFVFCLLSISYIAMAVSEEEH